MMTVKMRILRLEKVLTFEVSSAGTRSWRQLFAFGPSTTIVFLKIILTMMMMIRMMKVKI